MQWLLVEGLGGLKEMESRLPLLPAEEKLLPLVPEVDSELEQEKLPLKLEALATEARFHQ
jgi:hypothetical protein